MQQTQSMQGYVVSFCFGEAAVPLHGKRQWQHQPSWLRNLLTAIYRQVCEPSLHAHRLRHAMLLGKGQPPDA